MCFYARKEVTYVCVDTKDTRKNDPGSGSQTQSEVERSK
jgi:hypothetical protein